MKLRNVASPHAIKGIRGLVGLGLIAFAAMPVSPAFAEKDSQPAPAPATSAPSTPASAAPAAKPAASPSKAKAAAPAECVRTGQRVIAALARDDTGAAGQFFAFYNAFKCPPAHLAQSFACLVKLQSANPGLSSPSSEQVAQCWDDPAVIPKVSPPPPQPEQKHGQENGK